MNKTKSLLAAVALAAVAVSAQGQVFNTISGSFSGDSSYIPGGGSVPLGSLFQVTASSVDILSLAFVDPGNDGIAGSATVGIYKYNGSPIFGSFNASPVVQTTITGTGDLVQDQYVWKNIPTTSLTAGYYAILTTSVTLGAGDKYGDFQLGDSVPTFPNTGGIVAYPNGDISGGSIASPIYATGTRFKLVNFSFTPVPVPEPETYAMIAGVGLVAFGLWRRRQ